MKAQRPSYKKTTDRNAPPPARQRNAPAIDKRTERSAPGGRPWGSKQPNSRQPGSKQQRDSRQPRTRQDHPFERFAKPVTVKPDRLEPPRPRRSNRREEIEPDATPSYANTLTDAYSVRLNRFMAQSGVCARRQADKLILEGKVKVNGQTVTELGVKVNPQADVVLVNGKRISLQKFVYLLLNKPKNHVTTVNDPEGRRTVMDLVKGATPERIVPVGRLDRNTTGLLLFTNDGDLATRLTHPSFNIKKLYAVKLDKPISQEELQRLRQGIELEDGPIRADKVDYVTGGSPNEVGIEIHSGRNRVVRRMFEHLGYQVLALDRVGFAHLTKKGIPRGRWRFLTDKEVGFFKMLSPKHAR